MKGLPLILVLLSSSANAQYFKYSDIASSPPADQNMYIAGVVDALAQTPSINICLGRTLRMKAGQLTTNVMNYAAGRPALHALGMADVVAAYLKEACPQASSPGKSFRQ
ncbi:Na+/serine symporter [Bradyrhizobium yuanmingense]|uniref:Rap1a/Tai family immunity protein n=1 Tax=Bradyrhizobium yuanmingense TaxID=108015 RepID=UPI0035186FA6